jgi:hypothetical protein
MSLYSCGNTEASGYNQEVAAPAEVMELPEGFITAYEDYHSDSMAQMQHIQFPLSGKAKSGRDTIWEASGWALHQPYNRGSDLFRRSFRPVGSALILEDIIAPKLGLHMQRRWKKEDETWVLIYYKELQKIQGTDTVSLN